MPRLRQHLIDRRALLRAALNRESIDISFPEILEQVGVQPPGEFPPGTTEYQKKLSRHIKEAFIEMYRAGHTDLENFESEHIMSIAYYAQYKELLEPIQCPPGGRQARLVGVQNLVTQLKPEQKQDLESRLIGGDGGEKNSLQVTYKRIATLALDLYRGALLQVGRVNLLQRACQEALYEIG